MKLTQNLHTLVVMKHFKKTLLPLLRTKKIAGNWLTPNFSNAFQKQKRNIWITTKTVYTSRMKDLMKTLPPLFWTERMEETWLTHNFRNASEEPQKNIWIKVHGLKLIQNLYTLVGMKDLMKTQSPLPGKNCFHC